MEKVADAGRSGTRKPLRLAACAALALCGAVSSPGWAQQAGQAAETLVAQSGGLQRPPRMQVQASSLPQFDAQDASGFQSPRVDMTLYPSNRYRIGAMLGMSGFTQGSTPATAPYLQAPHANVDIGVRFSQRVQSQQIDIMAWRRMTSEDDAYALVQQHQPLYGARVEMNLSPADKTGLTAARGFLGFQLEGGARISFRRSNGRPMVYYRRTF